MTKTVMLALALLLGSLAASAAVSSDGFEPEWQYKLRASKYHPGLLAELKR